MRTAFVNGTVIDGTDGKALPLTAVVTDGNRIVEIGPQHPYPPDTRVVDVSGMTVMPGIIDTHMHFASWAQWLVSYPTQRLPYLISTSISALQKTLASGVTTARDMGGLDSGFAEGVRKGLIAGLRLQTAVVIISPTNGLNDNIPGLGGTISRWGQTMVIPGMPLPYCNGPWAARAKVREVVGAGADIIKFAPTTMTVRGVLDLMVAAFTQEEIDAIVDEAHTLGLTAHAHANGGLGLTRALRAGVDTIEHGTQLTDENVEEMARRGTWLVPMFWIVRYHAENAPEARGFAASPATHRDTMKRFYETSVNSFQRALKAGVRIALGSDAGSHDRHTNASMLEMQYMLDAGMSASEVIVSATRRAAECMRLQDEVGTLEAGKYADLVVVRGNPLQDLRLLAQRESIALVIKDGEAVGGTLLARDLGQIAAAAKA